MTALTMQYSENDAMPVPGLEFKETGSFYLDLWERCTPRSPTALTERP